MTSPHVANPLVVLTPAPTVKNERLKCNKKVLTGLGIVEVVIASLSIVFSCILIGYLQDPYYWPDDDDEYYYRFHTGEGIWCGVWILIGGALGIACGRKKTTLCLINCHMTFSIVGAIFSTVQLSLGITSAVVNGNPMSTGLGIMLFIGGLLTFILCIVSASYCCKTISSAGWSCCCGCCSESSYTEEQATPSSGGQVVFMENVQGLQQVQQGFIPTSTVLSGQTGVYPGSFVAVMHPGESASHRPADVALEQRTLSTGPSEFERKHQESVDPSSSGGVNATHDDSPPAYY